MQVVRLAFSFALAKAGRSMAAKMAMMAMTTSNSIKVNPRFISMKTEITGRNRLEKSGIANSLGRRTVVGPIDVRIAGITDFRCFLVA